MALSGFLLSAHIEFLGTRQASSGGIGLAPLAKPRTRLHENVAFGACMNIIQRLLAVLLSVALLTAAQGNSWDKVRYNGGTLQTKVDPKDWGNHLGVTSDFITLKLKDGH